MVTSFYWSQYKNWNLSNTIKTMSRYQYCRISGYWLAGLAGYWFILRRKMEWKGAYWKEINMVFRMPKFTPSFVNSDDDYPQYCVIISRAIPSFLQHHHKTIVTFDKCFTLRITKQLSFHRKCTILSWWVIFRIREAINSLGRGKIITLRIFTQELVLMCMEFFFVSLFSKWGNSQSCNFIVGKIVLHEILLFARAGPCTGP